MKHLREDSVVPYLDSRLDPAARARLEHHLKSCADCRAHLAELRAVLDELNAWPAPEPSPGFTAAVRARVEAAAAEPAPRGSWGWVYAGATVLVAAVLLMVVLWQPTPPLAPTPPSAESPETLAEEAGEELATLEPVLLENYDLLRDFDVLFETPTRENRN